MSATIGPGPRVCNMHHGAPPSGRVIYCGRSRKWGGPSPLANPFKLDGPRNAEAATRILGQYRRHLWERMQARDAAVLRALDSIPADGWIGCTCAPKPCHGDEIAKAWHLRRAWVRVELLIEGRGWALPPDPLALEIIAAGARTRGVDDLLARLAAELDGPEPTYALEPIGAALGERFECPRQLGRISDRAT